ncbi:RNA polymerase sigma factor SigZ [Flavobacterium collinsii]|nr:RNA polymerase sigma factor SigZ [Flavobacterium collinsii]
MQHCNIFEVWEDYKSSLLGYVKKRIDDPDDAKDILQEVLLKSYQYCSNGKEVIYLKSWLYKITQNAILDYYKKTNNKRITDFDIKEEIEEQSLIGEASDYVKVLLRLIPDKYAKPLYMSDIEGVDQKLIAKQLQLSLPNTKSRIQRARVKLKDKFLECCIVGFNESGEMDSFDIKPECTLLKIEKTKIEKQIAPNS